MQRSLWWRIRLVAVLGVLWLIAAACGKQPADRLQGRWAVDLEKTAASLTLPGDATSTTDPKDAIGMMRGIFGDIQLEITADQLIMTTRGVPQRASWQVKQQEGNSLVITTSAAEKPGHSRDLNVELEGDLLKLGMGKQRLVFRRAKGPAPEPPPASPEKPADPAKLVDPTQPPAGAADAAP